MINRSFAILAWLINLFDPPPLSSMTLAQKTGRVLFLTATLVIGSILVAMLGALGLFVMEKGREMGSTPEFLNGVCIIAIGISVNAACVLILVQLKRADNKLVPPPKRAGTEPAAFLKIKPDQPGSSEKKASPTEPSTDSEA
jgi:uncharacterized membrane protein YidH (DUF202 family)